MATTQITPEQIAKLPKGAQALIKQLQRRIEDLEGVIKRIEGPEDAHITALQETGYGRGESAAVQRIEAPYGVTFQLNEHEKVTVRRVEQNGKYALRLMAEGHPSQLAFVPQVTNVCIVKVVS